MQVLVTGAGRGGTNLVAAILRSFQNVVFDSGTEDRLFFTKSKLPSEYGAKLCTENPSFSMGNIRRMMKSNPNLKLIFSVRHPIDHCMSKIVRGQPNSNPLSDSSEIHGSPDGSLVTAIDAITFMHTMRRDLSKRYPNRILVVKMEDIILDLDNTIAQIADFIEVDHGTIQEDKLFDNLKNRHHKKRYGNKLDSSQINIYKRVETAYDGFFKDKEDYMDQIKSKLADVFEELKYGI